MFKRLRRYLKLKMLLQHEVLETLCTICLYLEHEGRFNRNPYCKHMGSHFNRLKELSEQVREEVEHGTERDFKKVN